ncbi:sodium:calcium antiporter [Thalassiella azotivora]
MTGAAWPLGWALAALAGAGAVIVLAGPPLTRAADGLAERLGLGRSLAGGVLLGAVTSLSGIATITTGGLSGQAEFALANPVGGVAVQTVWLTVADLAYRRTNLEHAAASLENMLQSLVLMALLAVPVVAYATPSLELGWVHPATLFIPVVYAGGLLLVRRTEGAPMWRAVDTDDTSDRESGPASGSSTWTLWGRLVVLGVVVAATGWAVGRAGVSVVERTQIPSGVVGFTLTTVITSLPELVTLVAAVRMGALTLGVGAVIGGNVFDTLQIALADLSYLEGSVYSAAGPEALVLLGGTMLMTAVLAAGLLVRQRRGIGFEGVTLPVLYVATAALVWAAA